MNTIKINMNEILEREQTYDKIELILKDFQENKKGEQHCTCSVSCPGMGAGVFAV